MRIGVDVGGTKVAAVALSRSREVVARTRIPSRRGNEGVMAAIVEAIEAVESLAPADRSGVESVGVGIPGVVDTRTGCVRQAVNLGVEELQLGTALQARWHTPVSVDNDVNAASLGAYTLLELTGSMAYVNLGTGLAAGIVTAGRLWHGGRGAAGEIGHLSLDPHGARCACGQHGCLETLASGSAIARRWPAPTRYPALDLFDAADAGNPRAVEVRADFTRAVAEVVTILALTVDPDLVVIGGGLSALGDRLVNLVRIELIARASGSPFLAGLDLAGRLRLVPAGGDAPAVGAALLDRATSAVPLP